MEPHISDVIDRMNEELAEEQDRNQKAQEELEELKEKLKQAESQSTEFAQMIEMLPDDMMDEYSWDTKGKRWVRCLYGLATYNDDEEDDEDE